MATTFRIKSHSQLEGVEVVEVLLDNEVVGVIYPAERGVKLVSAHIKDVERKDNAGELLPIPEISVRFDPQPYRIINSELVRFPRSEKEEL